MNREDWKKVFKDLKEMSDEDFEKFLDECSNDLDNVFMIMKEEVEDEN